jgi:hypothetical protein
MDPDQIFIETPDGRAIEVGNWKARQSDGDVFLGRPLSRNDEDQIEQGRRNGHSDPEIYEARRRDDKVEYILDLESLGTEQICRIAEQLLSEDIESLRQMRKEDLATLVRRLADIQDVEIAVQLGG